MKDVLIVGFGIAGLSVAKQLERRSKSFDVISDKSQQSSRVAGGVLNPVALKRYNLAWKAEDLMPEAIKFYRIFNSGSKATYFHSVPVYKLFSSVEDQNNWVVASDQPKLDPFLNSKFQKLQSSVESPFKAGEVLQSHLLHLKQLLHDEELRLTESSHFFSETIRYEEIKFSNNKIVYRNKEYKSVVFCEGYGVAENPFFNWLPIYGNKGEYLIFKSKALKANKSILKSRNFIIPLGDDIYKYGATYSRDNLNDRPTGAAREELEQRLSEMITCPYEIIDQVAGVRPTVRDRKPVLGVHPEHKNLYILNGFGSRGVMAAPYLSRQLVDLMFKNKTLEDDISLSRFLKFYA